MLYLPEPKFQNRLITLNQPWKWLRMPAIIAQLLQAIMKTHHLSSTNFRNLNISEKLLILSTPSWIHCYLISLSRILQQDWKRKWCKKRASSLKTFNRPAAELPYDRFNCTLNRIYALQNYKKSKICTWH